MLRLRFKFNDSRSKRLWPGARRICSRAIQDMRAQLMALWNAWVRKILSLIAPHADFRHYPTRRRVHRSGEGHDFVQPEPAEPICKRGPSSLGGVSPSPISFSEGPDDFHAGAGWHVVRDSGQAGEAHE